MYGIPFTVEKILPQVGTELGQLKFQIILHLSFANVMTC